MQKKIGAIEDDVLLIGGMAIGGILLVKYIGATFGTDPANQQKYDAKESIAPASNPFNPNFQPFLDYWQLNQPAGLTVLDGMLQIEQLGDSDGLDPGSQAQLTYQWAKTLESALSVWNWRVDTNAVLSVFNQMSTQVQCAALAAYVTYVLNKDLLHWLHYGGSAIPFIPNGLSVDQIAIIINQVDAMPQQ